jgi:UDP-GlcNAc:undecaprenyl-phosphate/decaprenyl-phosphate GlcNAc-1-phosphate transferase
VQLFLAFVVALSVTAALIPLLARWAPSIGLTDRPGPRKVHSAPVPRVGGLAMAAGLVAPLLLTVTLTPAVRGLLLGIGVLLVFGLWDDRTTLGYRTKFAGQLIAVGLYLLVGNVSVGALSLGGLGTLPAPVTTLIGFLFLIGITNAVNLADGLDGLAGGMVLLCLCAIALFAAMSGNRTVTTISLIEAGAVLGFLRFNTHPARIFMGDSGSQILGFSVGALALLATQGDSSPFSAALPLLLLGLPILDTITVMLLRIRAGRSPFAADSNHLHHRLLALGLAHREAVMLVYVLQVALVLCAYFMRFDSDLNVIFAFGVFALLVLGVLHWADRSGWRINQPDRTAGFRGYVNGLLPTQPGSRLSGAAVIIMTACLAFYAGAVLISSARPGRDLGVMSLAMLVVLLALSSWRAERSLRWFERAAAYVSVVLLVYLDQTTPNKPILLTELSWAIIAVIGVAALVGFWVSRRGSFELTTLDLIVIFVALVLPNLPGSIALPADLPGGVAKAVILLYVVEMLLSIDLKHLMPRLFLGVTLAVIAGRSLIVGLAA